MKKRFFWVSELGRQGIPMAMFVGIFCGLLISYALRINDKDLRNLPHEALFCFVGGFGVFGLCWTGLTFSSGMGIGVSLITGAAVIMGLTLFQSPKLILYFCLGYFPGTILALGLVYFMGCASKKQKTG